MNNLINKITNIFKSKSKSIILPYEKCDFFADDLSYINECCKCDIDDCKVLQNRYKQKDNIIIHISATKLPPNDTIDVYNITSITFDSWKQIIYTTIEQGEVIHRTHMSIEKAEEIGYINTDALKDIIKVLFG